MLKKPRFWAGVCTLVLAPAISALGLLISNMANETNNNTKASANENTNAKTNDNA